MNFEIPYNALLGGVLLGLSAALLMLFSGKIAGISGAISGLVNYKKGDYLWRFLFLLGMVVSPLLLGREYSFPELGEQNYFLVILSGLLVGFGTRLGNGCTSGHGIVGIGRFSKRSIVATITFMTVGILTVAFTNFFGG